MTAGNLAIGPMTEADLPAVSMIQAANPAASQWDPRVYLTYHALVARLAGLVAGFIVTRDTGPAESEILNLAVHPDRKRRGIGRSLIHRVAPAAGHQLFLEVRESNVEAREFYKALGFIEIGTRANYYNYPKESGIVMKLQK
jgi:ribosomal protein S18 acetylase RimI-like enzyme